MRQYLVHRRLGFAIRPLSNLAAIGTSPPRTHLLQLSKRNHQQVHADSCFPHQCTCIYDISSGPGLKNHTVEDPA